MVYLSETDRINAIISDPAHAPMTLAQIISEEIRDFKASEKRHLMIEADQYYKNRTDVQKKTNEIQNRSNTKIEHPILKKLIDQKVSYLLSRSWTIDVEKKTYGDALNKVFDQTFRQKIKSLGKEAIKSGIAWLLPYFDASGKLAFMRIPASELIPLWKDMEHAQLDAIIRFYDEIVYEGNTRKIVTHAEYWYAGGVKRFFSCGNDSFEVDDQYGNEANDWTEPHFMIGDKAYNWEQVPIVWLRYNEEELPLHYFVKELIDDINWQTSVTADVLRDVAKFIYILRNYGGTDLAEFINDLKENLAIKVDTDGGVDKLQADLNIDAVMAFLDKQRRDLYDYASAVDTKDPDLGNASGTAINFRYMDLDSDCQALASEMQEMFKRLKIFIDTYLQITGKGDFTEDTFEIVFNSDMPVNETDVINNARSSEGLISKHTILQNHPWVKDVDEELKMLDEEKKQAMEDYGAGMFDGPPQVGGVIDGRNEGVREETEEE